MKMMVGRMSEGPSSGLLSLSLAASCSICALLFVRNRRHQALLKSDENIKSKKKKRSTDWIRCEIMVAKDEVRYRKFVKTGIRETDCVIELGCHVGVTTSIAASCASRGLGIGIDSSAFSIGKARERHSASNLYFLPPTDSANLSLVKKRLAELEAFKGKVDVVCIDVSGSRPPGFVLGLLEAYDRVFSPRLFIIKNFKLQNLVAQCTNYG